MSYHIMAEVAKKRLSRVIDAAFERELAAHREAFTPKLEIGSGYTNWIGHMQNHTPTLQDLIRQQQAQMQCHNQYTQGYQSLGQALFGRMF